MDHAHPIGDQHQRLRPGTWELFPAHDHQHRVHPGANNAAQHNHTAKHRAVDPRGCRWHLVSDVGDELRLHEPDRPAANHQRQRHRYLHPVRTRVHQQHFQRSANSVLLMKTVLAVLLLALNCQAAMRPGYSTEVNRWSYAAKTNFGSISARTLSAATVWVRDVYSAGIRSKIYRANLFAGDTFTPSSSTGMGAVQVPIIRDYGNGIDVSGAANSTWTYVERGSSGGLHTDIVNLSTLDTGLVPTSVYADSTSGHILLHVRTSSNESSLTGCERTGSNDNFLMSNGPYVSASVLGGAFVGNSYVTYSDSGGTGYYLCSRTTSTLITLYKNCTSV